MSTKNLIVTIGNGEGIYKTVDEYLLGSLEYEMVKNWRNCLQSADVKLLWGGLCESKELLENISRKTSNLTVEDISKLQTQGRKCAIIGNNVRQKQKKLNDRVYSSLTNVRDKSSKIFNPFINNCQIMTNLFDLFSVPLPSECCSIFGTVIKNEKAFLKSLLPYMESEIGSLKVIMQYMALLIISKVDDNMELYRFHVPNFDGTELDRCLLCTQLVDLFHYTKFADCCHKICSDCTETYLPERGKCPFDGKGSVDFMIHEEKKIKVQQDELVSQYIRTHCRDINLKKLMNLISINVGLVNEATKYINKYFLPMNNICKQIMDEKKGLNKKVLLKSLKTMFIEIADNSFVHFGDITSLRIKLLQEDQVLETDTSKKSNTKNKEMMDIISKIMKKFFHMLSQMNESMLYIMSLDRKHRSCFIIKNNIIVFITYKFLKELIDDLNYFYKWTLEDNEELHRDLPLKELIEDLNYFYKCLERLRKK